MPTQEAKQIVLKDDAEPEKNPPSPPAGSPPARRVKTVASRAAEAASGAKTTRPAKGGAKTRKATRKTPVKIATVSPKNDIARDLRSVVNGAEKATKAAAEAVSLSKRAAKLGRDVQIEAVSARDMKAAAIKTRAKANCVKIEAGQKQDLAAGPRQTLKRRVTKFRQAAKTAKAKAKAKAKEAAAIASRTKAEAEAVMAKVKEVENAVKQTQTAARKAETAITSIASGTKETGARKQASSKAGEDMKTLGTAAVACARAKADAERAAKRARTAAERAWDAKTEIGRDLKAPELYLNREFTLLSFYMRVLREAEDPNKPLLERVKFLAIVGSNLDEFFMKRIGGLKQQVGAGVHKLTVDGRTPEEQISKSVDLIREIESRAHKVYHKLMDGLRENGIIISSFTDLSPDDQAGVRAFYLENIFPLVTPLAMDAAHPFPHLSNLSLNLLVTLCMSGEATPVMTRVKVPTGSAVSRFIQVGSTNRFVLLEDVMANNLDILFPEVEVLDCVSFRVTRNSNTELDEDSADDLLEMIESEVRDRRFAPIVRLETEKTIEPTNRGMLAAELGLDETEDVFESDIMLGLRDLMEIAEIDDGGLHYPDHLPIDNVALQDPRNIFHIIRNRGPILLHHPYESFTTSVVRFVREACQDPKVLAIKMTIYRTTEGTGIIDYLIEAARNGKQVAVSVELKARFDESANIKWASRMEEAGIHVTYGVVGIKTHPKLVLVIRRDYSGLRRYAHIGTGNYHAGTARLYADFGLLTCDDEVGSDLVNFFNFLTSGCQPGRRYSKIHVSPRSMKDHLLAKIDREIYKHSIRSPGLIRFKTNALEDRDITEALYGASLAGVRVELIIRDTCRIRPGIPGLSDNISVISVVGRFLEHSRVYYFRNGGEEEYFIGSADLMMRNLEHRAEVIVNVEDKSLCKELSEFLEMQLNDRRNVWDMLPDGSYSHRQVGDVDDHPGCHQAMIDATEKRHRNAEKAKLGRPKAIAKRSKRS